MDLVFTLKEVLAFGSACVVAGGLTQRVHVHGKNITSLWNQKQDKNVCEPVHEGIKDDITEIKDNVDWLVKDRKNGGQGR